MKYIDDRILKEKTVRIKPIYAEPMFYFTFKIKKNSF